MWPIYTVYLYISIESFLMDPSKRQDTENEKIYIVLYP